MPSSLDQPRLVGWSCRLFAALTRAYTPAFCKDYGAEMVRLFGDCCLAAHRDDGNWGLLAVWGQALVDLLCNAPADRAQELLRDHCARRLLCTLGPVALFLGCLVCWTEVHNDKVDASAGQLLLFTALLGFAQPRLAFLWALSLGAFVPATHALARLSGWQLPYPTNGWTPLFALLALVPAVGGAYAGAWGRWVLDRVRPNLQMPAVALVVGLLLIAAVYQGVRALDIRPDCSVARLPHDPWQTLVRDMDKTLSVFRKETLYSNEWDQGGGQAPNVCVMRAPLNPPDARPATGPRLAGAPASRRGTQPSAPSNLSE
jgi:hypothetical protein